MNYEIKNMMGFCKTIGFTVADEIGMSPKEFKNYIKPSNVRKIAEQYCTKKGRSYFIEEEKIDDIYEDTRNWVIGIDLAKLAAQDKLECYWDDDINQMVFQKKNMESE